MKLFTGILLYSFCIPAYALDVFFVHSYHHAYPWVDEYYDTFKDKLETDSLEEYQMDTKRIPQDEFQARADEAINLILQKKPHVVVVADDNALRLVGKPALDHGFQVVFLGINGNPRLVIPITSNLAGVLERPLLKRSVVELARVVPRLKKVLILMDDGPTTTAIIDTSFNSKTSQKVAGTEVNIKRLKHFSDWKKEILQSKHNGYDIILLASYAKLLDEKNQAIELDIVSRWSSKHSELPIFACWRYSIGKDMVAGGLVLSGNDQGKNSAEIVNYFLRHQQFPNPSIITPKQGRYLFSKTQVDRWNLKLPTDIEKHVEWIE
ncbi:ABC transporter substrate-binding protein [Neptuniibacter sp. QD48_55]|uniref:ABC transporter substrate-binding protein n=1 Tax=Neptuniibacter sp. QD48_55 TaxID=3398212 RepID=UPI0039F4E7BC